MAEFLDGGSDLSDLSDSDSIDVPLSPGPASTPRTTPTPIEKKKKSTSKSHSQSIDEPAEEDVKVKSNVKVSKTEQKGKGRGFDIESKAKERQGSGRKKAEETDKWADGNRNGISGIADAKETTSEDKMHKEGSAVVEAGRAVTKTIQKKQSMKGWTYVEEPRETEVKEDLILNGKRTRKPTLQNLKSLKSDRKASSSAKSPLEQGRETKTSGSSAADVGNNESKPRLKISLKFTSKDKQDSTSNLVEGDDREKSEESVAEPLSISPAYQDDDDDDEDVGPLIKKKRKRAKGQLKEEEDVADEYMDGREEKSQRQQSIARKSGQAFQSKKREKKEREGKRRKNEIFAADDESDEYHEGQDINDDEAMSEADDDEEVPAVRHSKAAHIDNATPPVMPRLKRKSESIQASEAKTVPRHSTGSIPVKKPTTVAGVINTFSKPASTLSTQTTSAKSNLVKAAVRKVPSMNLFDNLMGFGSSAKESSTPGKPPAVRPRPSGSGISTPQGTSPMVRPPGSIKKEEEASISDSATPTKIQQSSLSKPSPLASNGRPKLGANGEHVTAAEMAIRREQELYSNAHPTGLFDLLEGAEIMLQFEAENRELVVHDAILSKYKLYKASRTEGISKLVDRIKESNKSHHTTQPTLPPSQTAI